MQKNMHLHKNLIKFNVVLYRWSSKKAWCAIAIDNRISMNIFNHSLFADADTGFFPHEALQFHTQRKAKRSSAMLRVDKFPYPQKQTRGNNFIACSKDICHIRECFRILKSSAMT